MQTAIKDVQNMLDRLPEESTIEDIQYHIYVMDKVKRGLESVEKDGGVSHEDAKRRFAKWLQD